MERLYSVRDICDRYQIKPTTARKLIRDMVHLERPLMVSERAVRDWEQRHTRPPESLTRQIVRKGGVKGACR
jgi:DNA-binding transcriptional regulator YiaG